MYICVCVCIALAALAGSQLRSNSSGTNINNRSGGGQQTHEMTVPNDLIGCIIGKGGTKIAEIRYVRGGVSLGMELWSG